MEPRDEKAWMDYSHEVRPLKAGWKRNLLIVAGTLSFALGVLGIFLPLLPTTPFLLLAGACYARASTKFYNWLMNHRVLGGYIRDWRSNKGIPVRTKVLALSLMAICFGISAVLVVKSLYPRIGFLSIGVLVAIYIIRLPTRRQSEVPKKGT